jgi:hypothetical protein
MHRLRNVFRGLAAVVACVLAESPGSAAEPPKEGIHVLHGRWVYAGDDVERQRRLDAVESTVGEMSWLVRGVARRRIRTSTAIHQWYEFVVNGDLLTIIEAAGNRFSTRWDGTPLRVPRSRGGPATLTRSWENGVLRSHWIEPTGEGKEVYSVAGDGDALAVDVTIASRRLPSTIEYRLTYRRLPSETRIDRRRP